MENKPRERNCRIYQDVLNVWTLSWYGNNPVYYHTKEMKSFQECLDEAKKQKFNRIHIGESLLNINQVNAEVHEEMCKNTHKATAQLKRLTAKLKQTA